MSAFPCFRSMPWALLFSSLILTACFVSTDQREATPEQVLPRLLAVLKDPNPELRRTAAQSLGKIARKEAVPALLEALRDPDAGVRRQAAWAMGMIGEDAVGPDRSPLAPLLFDADPDVREAAATALGLTGDTQAGIELLLERLREPGTSSDSRRLAAASLGGMEARSAVTALIGLLADPDLRVRRWAAAALGEIADERAVKPLGALTMKDPDPGVRLEAAFRLGKFGGVAARPALTAALKDANADVRRVAAAGLKEP
ncbi:MAG: HEAT repeat domain-containing protein [Nitrospirae bacterium]|nr:MAG: HEAT repeat domain-containing protein [Nitrospirota bacterium]